MDPVTLYSPDGRSTTVRSAVERTNLLASGYSTTAPNAVAVETPAGDGPAEFNPAEHNVPDVLAFVEAHPELADAVVNAEKAGKNRTSITGSHDA